MGFTSGTARPSARVGSAFVYTGCPAFMAAEKLGHCSLSTPWEGGREGGGREGGRERGSEGRRERGREGRREREGRKMKCKYSPLASTCSMNSQ